MQVHGDDVVGAGHRQHVGHQLGADGSSDGNKKNALKQGSVIG